MLESDRKVERRDVRPGESEHCVIELEAESASTGQMAAQPIQRVTRPGEQVDHESAALRTCPARDGGYVTADGVGEHVPGAFDGRPAQEPNSLPEPLRRRLVVDGHIVRVSVSVAAVTLDLPEFEDFVAFHAVQQ